MTDDASELPALFDDFDDADIDRLMKRCQNGVGGRPSVVYAQANELAAECYGTIGRLRANGKAYRSRMEALATRLRERGMASHRPHCVFIMTAHLDGHGQCTCGLDALLAACVREEG